MPKERALFWLSGSYGRGAAKVTPLAHERSLNGFDSEVECYPAGYGADMHLRHSLSVTGRVTEEGMVLTVRFGTAPYGSGAVVWSTVIPLPSAEEEASGA